MKLITALVVLLLAGCASWTPETRREEIAFQALSAVDATQTIRIAREPDRFSESNPILGEHPSTRRVATYFAANGVLHFAATSLLEEAHAPQWLVRTWEAVGIVIEGRDVALNISHGIYRGEGRTTLPSTSCLQYYLQKGYTPSQALAACR